MQIRVPAMHFGANFPGNQPLTASRPRVKWGEDPYDDKELPGL